MADDIKELVAGILGVEVETLTDDLAAGDIPEWDSLRHMMILTALEKEYGFKFCREELIDIEDLADLIALVEEKVV